MTFGTHHQCVHRQLFVLVMQGELETLGEQVLQHNLDLFLRGPCGRLGHDVKSLGMQPVRAACDLGTPYPISVYHQIADRTEGVCDAAGIAAARTALLAEPDRAVAGGRRRGFYRGHFEFELWFRGFCVDGRLGAPASKATR